MSKITMCARIVIYGSNDSTKNFITQLQYEFVEKEYRSVTAHNADNEDKGKICYHYKVVEDNVDYWIPGIYCVEYDGPIGIYNEQGQYGNVIPTEELLVNKGEYERRKFSNEDFAPNVSNQAKLMLGRHISNRYTPDIDREYARLRKSANKYNKGNEENL